MMVDATMAAAIVKISMPAYGVPVAPLWFACIPSLAIERLDLLSVPCGGLTRRPALDGGPV